MSVGQRRGFIRCTIVGVVSATCVCVVPHLHCTQQAHHIGCAKMQCIVAFMVQAKLQIICSIQQDRHR